MKKTNKIISLVSAMGIVASIFSAFAISASATAAPVITLEGTANGKTSGSELTLTVQYTNDSDDESINMAQGVISFDTEYLSFNKSTKNVVKAELSKTNPDQVKYAFVAMDEDSYIKTKDETITTIVFNIIKDIDKSIEFTTSGMKVALYKDDASVEYTVGGTNNLTVNTYTLTPDASITIAAGSSTVVKGDSTAITVTPANFAEAPTEYTWTVTGNSSSSTKVEADNDGYKLTVGADETASTIKVKAAAGDVVSNEIEITVADKVYPLTVTADSFKDNKTTISITPSTGADDPYVADTKYKVTVQFYTSSSSSAEPSGYVEIEDLTNAQTLTVGSQVATAANVTIEDKDGNIIGRFEGKK